jgi:hypothetical protein
MKAKIILTKFSGMTAILFLGAGIGLRAAEEEKLTVGDPAVSGSFIKPYQNAFQLSLQKKDDVEPALLATWSDEVETVRVNGRSLMKRTQIAHYIKKDITVTTVNVFDPATMQPISMDETRVGMTGFTHRQFEGAAIKYRRIDPGKEELQEGEAKFDMPVFDFYGGMWGLLLSACPLREGYKATLPSVAENEEKLRWCKFEVTGTETVDAGVGKKAKAWVVKTDDNGAMTFWVIKEAPYVLKLIYVTPTGTFTYSIA